MVSTPLPGGLIANPQFGGQSSFTVVPSFAQTHSAPVGEWGGSPGSNVVTGDISFPVENGIDASPIVPVDTAIVDPTPGGLLDPGAHMLTIWGDLFLDSDSSLSNWRAFDLDAGGGLLTLMLYSTDPNANWSDILASGGELTGFGILNLTGVALNESTGGQIPEPATVALWLALGTAGVYWHRRHRRA
ncbi:MAG TPA: PEP-CTERM sorting domain-containing protein [Gemmatales bacterium]|nr:PEP-CTERM sorting domain-containing protein [Gemmatales bacterium]